MRKYLHFVLICLKHTFTYIVVTIPEDSLFFKYLTPAF